MILAYAFSTAKTPKNQMKTIFSFVEAAKIEADTSQNILKVGERAKCVVERAI